MVTPVWNAALKQRFSTGSRKLYHTHPGDTWQYLHRLQEAIPHTPGDTRQYLHIFGRYICGWRLLAGGLGIGVSMSLCKDDPSACTAASNDCRTEAEKPCPHPQSWLLLTNKWKKTQSTLSPRMHPGHWNQTPWEWVGDQGLQKLPWRMESMQTGKWKWRWKPFLFYSQVTRRLSRKPYFPDSFVLPLGFRQDNSSPGWHSREVSQRLLLLGSLDSFLQLKQWFYFPQFQCSGGVVMFSTGLSFTQVLVIPSSSRVPFRSFIANFCCCFQPMVWFPHPYTHIPIGPD